MKKYFKRLTALTVTAVMLACVLSTAAVAVDTRSSAYLSGYCISVTAENGGKIIVNVDVDATHTMDEVGATSITIWRSSDGENFTSVKTYNSDDYPELLGSGLHFNEDVITYYGTPGYYYCASGYCYAGDSRGSDSRYYMSSDVLAIK